MGWSAYVHPAAMVGVLLLGLWVLREGLRLRRGRLARRPADARRHVRLARPFVTLVVVGWGSGVASMIWLRERAPLDSVHALLATIVLLCLAGAGLLGLRLLHSPSPAVRRVHALAGAAGLLLALAAAVAGVAILP